MERSHDRRPEGEATILHADLDAFYASVEQLLDPSLRGIPLAVGGGVVLAASYEAKAFGVHGGMSGRLARQLCPHLRFVPGRFSEYQRFADQVMDIFGDFTPKVERISIDEAFLDVVGAIHLFGPPEKIARDIRRRVRDEVGLPVSIGVARTKHLAKIASQVAKPDGLVVVEPERELEFLHPLPVGLMWGVGPVTKKRLEDAGIRTIGELAELGDATLDRMLGRAVARRLSALAWNDDPRTIAPGRRARSVGAQSALGRTPIDRDELAAVVRHLADRVGPRLRKKDRAGHTVTVRIRFEDMRSVTRSTTLPAPISSTPMIAEIAEELLDRALADHPQERYVTLVGISVSHLVDEVALQLTLPLGLEGEQDHPGSPAGAGRWQVDRSVDEVRRRFGRTAVGYASDLLSERKLVPDAFRELAERDGD